jgi:hypothetical protein
MKSQHCDAMILTMLFSVGGRRNGWVGGQRDGWMAGWVGGGMGGWVGLRNGFKGGV